jgi:hypothetical protein
MKLSKHFIKRWEERVGQPLPAPKEIKRMIRCAIWLQKDQVLYSTKGLRYKIPALYWVPDKNIVLKVDEKTKTVMTVITPDI